MAAQPRRQAFDRRFSLRTVGAQLMFMSALLLLLPSAGFAAAACPVAEAAWASSTASGNPLTYGYTVSGVVQASKNGATTPLANAGTIKFLSFSVVQSQNGATVSGVVSGSEKQNLGGALSTLTFGGDNSTFVFSTGDCTGTVTRTFTNGSVVVWNVVLVDGADSIRYVDTRGNPMVQPGVLQLMK